MSTRPKQCLQNPWERAWVQENGGDSADYPRNRNALGRLGVEETKIIKDFYRELGITVYEVKDVPMGHTRAHCSYPASYKLFLRVADLDAQRMEGHGYQREVPP